MTTTVTDKLILIAKDLGLPPKTEDFLRQADQAVTEAVGDAARMAGDYTRTNRDKISEALDKAERAVVEKTDGKYAEALTKVRATADKGIAKLASLSESTPGGTSEATPETKAPSDTDHTAATDGTHAVPPRPVWAEATDASDWSGEPKNQS